MTRTESNDAGAGAELKAMLNAITQRVPRPTEVATGSNLFAVNLGIRLAMPIFSTVNMKPGEGHG